MANTKTSDLTALAGSALDVADYFPCLDSSASTLKKLLASAIALIDSGKTAGFTAAPGYHYRLDMSSASADAEIAFPASPAIGDFFAYTLTRAHASWNLTINRNGNNVYGGTNVALYTTKEAGHTSIWRWDSTTTGQGWIRMNEPKVNVQTFTADGTWVKPPGALYVIADLIGGGSGGGSGRRYAAGVGRAGGGGGAGGARVLAIIPASSLSSTQSVTVGAGGAGGAAVTTNSTDGNSGSLGAASVFGPITTKQANAAGGGGEYGGSAGQFDAQSCNLFGSGITPVAGGGGSVFGAGGSPLDTNLVPCAGGGGGSVNSSNSTTNAGAGGAISSNSSLGASMTAAVAGTSPGGAGNAGSSGVTTGLVVGGGGSGGGGHSAGAGGAGGAGGLYGGGGGGGGGCVDGNNSGAGGAGASGIVQIVTFCR